MMIPGFPRASGGKSKKMDYIGSRHATDNNSKTYPGGFSAGDIALRLAWRSADQGGYTTLYESWGYAPGSVIRYLSLQYKILDGSETSWTGSSAGGLLLVYRPNIPIVSVTLGKSGLFFSSADNPLVLDKGVSEGDFMFMCGTTASYGNANSTLNPSTADFNITTSGSHYRGLMTPDKNMTKNYTENTLDTNSVAAGFVVAHITLE
ncbi:MAG: hypothetical protein WC997_02445 [Porticoccaceae bacterium]